MGEMTAEERDELRRDLEAAGCPYLANAIGDFLGGAYITELRSLLRREERLRVMEAGVRAADRMTTLTLGLAGELGYSHLSPRGKHAAFLNDGETFRAAVDLLETEVPDGQG